MMTRLKSLLMQGFVLQSGAWIVDVLIIGGSVWGVHLVDGAPSHPQLSLLVIITAGSLMALSSDLLYRSWRVDELAFILRSVALIWSVIACVTAAGLLIVGVLGVADVGWYLAWVLMAGCLLMMQRVFAYGTLHVLRRLGLNHKSVLLIGADASVSPLRQRLSELTWIGIDVHAAVEFDGLSHWLHSSTRDLPDEFWLCCGLDQQHLIEQAVRLLGNRQRPIKIFPDTLATHLIARRLVGSLSAEIVDISTYPAGVFTRLVKNGLDRVVALCVLVGGLPILLLIGVLIKLDSTGPILFSQVRAGWHGLPITIYKFRTLRVDGQADGPLQQVTRGDARMTRVGRWLRRFSLDEIPQFINILQGTMSIVGPRPHAMAHHEYYQSKIPGYLLRHRVKPGLTGWAQINGFRGETETIDQMATRVAYDLYYVENISIWLDVRIIALSLIKGFWHPKAY
jgi:putative colanic acid biosynthesis UDP-glucose lipid carrier transferase